MPKHILLLIVDAECEFKDLLSEIQTNLESVDTELAINEVLLTGLPIEDNLVKQLLNKYDND